jgi:predicted lipoprotein with Yx(FWY)xxD motif
MTRTRRPLLTFGLGAVVLLAACGSSGSSKTGSAATTGATTSSTPSGATTTGGGGRYGSATSAPPTTATAGSAGVVVKVTTTKLGLTLVDANGHTLYEYMPDPTGSSTCTGGCATIWPPLTAPGTTVAIGPHLTASLFSTVSGASGAHIVAIAGHPLYRFSGDAKAGQTNGQGFGGVWHAAGPLGGTM